MYDRERPQRQQRRTILEEYFALLLRDLSDFAICDCFAMIVGYALLF